MKVEAESDNQLQFEDEGADILLAIINRYETV